MAAPGLAGDYRATDTLTMKKESLMATHQTPTTDSIGFTGLLGLLFIALKLTGVIAWSWWWVLSPLWGPASLVLISVVLYVAYRFIKDVRAERRLRRKLAQVRRVAWHQTSCGEEKPERTTGRRDLLKVKKLGGK